MGIHNRSGKKKGVRQCNPHGIEKRNHLLVERPIPQNECKHDYIQCVEAKERILAELGKRLGCGISSLLGDCRWGSSKKPQLHLAMWTSETPRICFREAGENWLLGDGRGGSEAGNKPTERGRG
jgi:hypothetical protein